MSFEQMTDGSMVHTTRGYMVCLSGAATVAMHDERVTHANDLPAYLQTIQRLIRMKSKSLAIVISGTVLLRFSIEIEWDN